MPVAPTVGPWRVQVSGTVLQGDLRLNIQEKNFLSTIVIVLLFFVLLFFPCSTPKKNYFLKF